MPVYEYVCPTCDITFEQLRPFSASDQASRCPRCQTDARRTISLIARATSAGPTAMGNELPMMGGCACGGACNC